MSYEGHYEYLCPVGHYWTVDTAVMTWGEKKEREHALTCSCCGEKAKWSCSVDETNGHEAENPHTFGGKKTNIGYDEIEHRDHRGNQYFTKENKYAPDLTPVYMADSSRVIQRWFAVD